MYTFQYFIKIDNYTTVSSEIFSTFVISEVFELESLNSFSLAQRFTLGKPLQVQPIVKITNKDGRPMINKRAIALSWVEPQFRSIDGSKINPSNLKYFSLENVISEPSNDEGIAIFKNLTIIGTTESHAYIHFY